MIKDKFMVWKRERENLFLALIMMLLPLLTCIISCAVQGRNIMEVYLPNSEWNDELFYYKQVEGMVRYGFPQGYFGFNESHALKFSFAAWSPILVWPWILWGLIFGWNLQSPIWCNIVLMMLTMFGFVRLTRPTRRQLGVLAFLFITFTPFTRYMLSGMPEVICFSMAIYVFALGISYMRQEPVMKLIFMFLLSAVMVLMRPYLIVFMLLPIYFLVKKKRMIGIMISVLITGITCVIYFGVKYYFGAEYFTPLFDVTWVKKFLEDGILSGCKYVCYRLWTMGTIFIKMLWESFRSGLPAGSRFAAFMLVMFLLFWQTGVDFRKKDKSELVKHAYLALCFFLMWIALLLMYKMDEGSKHLHTFTAVGIFAISLMSTVFFRKVILTAGVFFYLFVIMATSSYEYQIPFSTEERTEMLVAWEKIFEENINLDTENAPTFENNIIWVFDDVVEDERKYTPWQYLYSLPEGVGISCCLQDYILEHFDTLHSKYLAVVQGGSVEEMCRKANKDMLAEHGGMVVYVLH